MKNRRNNPEGLQHNRSRRTLFGAFLLLFAFLAAGLFTASVSAYLKAGSNNIDPREEQTVSDPSRFPADQHFIVYFIDVGQGDSSLILCDGHSMLIDGGQSKQSDRIYTFLKEKGVTHLDYIIATHLDDDHLGGLPGALNYATAGTALSPVTDSDSKSFKNFKKYLDKQNVEITVPEAGDQYSLGSAMITILGPTRNSDSDNNNSIVLRVDHGDYSFLFTGDAERKEESDILSTGADLKTSVLKIGHHGSSSSTGDDFLAAADPAAAVISCGPNNEYGHPTEEVLKKLKDHDVRVYRTDLQGDIAFFENDGNLNFEIQKNPDADVFIPGSVPAENSRSLPMQETGQSTGTGASDNTFDTKGGAADSAPEKHEMDYIVNVNTGKFHYPSCRSVKQMKESNKRYVTCDRQDLIDKGYESCGNCHP